MATIERMARASLTLVLVAAAFTPATATPNITSTDVIPNAVSGGIDVQDDLATGTVSFVAPLVFPAARGSAIVDLRPHYSAQVARTEWGQGWDVPLCIVRTSSGRSDLRALGTTSDTLRSPWGELVRGKDGRWYPRNLTPPVSVAVQDANTLMAYLPSGEVHVLGQNAVERTDGIVTRWCPTEVRAPDGRTTVLDWSSEVTPSRWENIALARRLYLRSVRYGGVFLDGAYRVDIQYDTVPDAQVISTYAPSVGGAWIDRRVSSVVVTTGTTRLVKHTFRWNADRAFVLEHIDTTRGGAADVDRTLSFAYEDEDPHPQVAVSKLAPVLGWSELRQPFRLDLPFVQVFDFDSDGVSDVELRSPVLAPGTDASTVIRLMASDGFKPTTVVQDPGADPSCWFAALQAVRPVFRPIWSPLDGNPDVVYLTSDKTTSPGPMLVLCDAAGHRLSGQTVPTLPTYPLPGAVWPNVGTTPFLIDVDGDGRNDIVDVGAKQQITTYRNDSTLVGPQHDKRSFYFDKPIKPHLASGLGDVVTAVDYNADGLMELASFSPLEPSSPLGSWKIVGEVSLNDGTTFIDPRVVPKIVGTGRMRKLGVEVSLPPDVDGKTCVTTMYDADADGWAEPWLVCQLKNSDVKRLYRGVQRHMHFDDDLSRSHLYTAEAVPGVEGGWMQLGADFERKGGFQVVFAHDGQLQTALLASPSVGLVVETTDSSTGNSSRIEYALPPAGNNLGAGQPVVRTLARYRGSEHLEDTVYTYAGPQYAPTRRQFLGFSQVIRESTPVGGVWRRETTTLTADERVGMKIEHVLREDGTSTRPTYIDYLREERSYEGIPYFEVRRISTGIISDIDVTGFKGAIELTRTTRTHCARRHEVDDECPIDRDDPPHCPSSEFRTAGTTTRQTTRTRFIGSGDPWDVALTCLTDEERVFGWDGGQARFLGATRTTRNAWGSVTEEAVASSETSYRVTKTNVFNNDGTLASEATPGGGVTRYTYDAKDRPLFTTMTDPAGVVTRVVQRNWIAEQPEHTDVTRGSTTTSAYSKFDAAGHLIARWNSLGGSASHPLVEFAYWDASSTVTRGARAFAVTRYTPPGVVMIEHPEMGTDVLSLSAADESFDLKAAVVNGVWSSVIVDRHASAGETREHYLHTSSTPSTTVPDLASIEAMGAETLRETRSPLAQLVETSILPPEGGAMATTTRQLVGVDSVDRLLTWEIRRPDGELYREVSDADGSIYEMCAVLSEICVYTDRDALARVTDVFMSSGRTHLDWGFDGQIEELHWGNGLFARYDHDSFGRLEVATVYDPGLQIVSRTRIGYDSIGRLHTKESTDRASTSPVLTTYTYGTGDQAGFLGHISAPDRIAGMKWDGLGRLVQEVSRFSRDLGPQNEITDLVRRYTLRGDGSLSDENVTFGTYVGATHDEQQLDLHFTHRAGDGLATGIEVIGGPELAFRYDGPDASLPSLEVVRNTGVTQRCSLERVAPFAPNAWSCQGQEGGAWDYSVARSPTWARAEVLAGSASTFDHMRGRLTGTASTIGTVERYTHEGDRTLRGIYGATGAPIVELAAWAPGQHDGARVLDDQGRVSTDAATHYAYDANGRLTSIATGASEVTLVRDPEGTPLAELADHVRVAVWSGDVCSDADGTVWKSVEIAGVPLLAVSSKGTVELLRSDANGTTHTSATVGSEPYGLRERAALPQHCFAQFAGMRATSVDGLYLAAVRDYASTLGRFLEPDPHVLYSPSTCDADPFGCANYGYADGDPTSRVDPLGLRARNPDAKGPHSGMERSFEFDEVTIEGRVTTIDFPPDCMNCDPPLFDGTDIIEDLRKEKLLAQVAEQSSRTSPAEAAAPVGSAYGVNFDLAAITPGGGGNKGVNWEHIPEDGAWYKGRWYKYKTPIEQLHRSFGFQFGAAIQGNYAFGRGPWTGDFKNISLSLGIVSVGFFYSSPFNNQGEFWVGVAGGVGAGPPGLGASVTNYEAVTP